MTSRSGDRVMINDLRVSAVVGVLAQEREMAQPLRIDLSIGVDLHDAAMSDELGDTVDYGLVAEQVAAAISSSKHVLLERLAGEVAELVLGFNRVDDVDVTITKLRPPIPLTLESTAVQLFRTSVDESFDQLNSHIAYIALGSNLGDRMEFLRGAVAALGSVTAMSHVYETEPIGGPDAQGPYLNMIVRVETVLDPFALLRRCRRIEQAAMRQRVVHWGPRTLDVDLLFFDDIRISSETLTIPHPRINERRFVLVPLAEIAPELCPPGWDEALPAATVTQIGELPVQPHRDSN
ncbi:2-amino-4-hydroxy-6-hydroxymethyldihydropteridinediphosphokinase [soil metagenome]